MPHIDARSGEIVIRIVYDGAPEAGKTTNVQQLGHLISLQRRGVAKSPGTHGARTEFFDWLDFSGGYLDGRRVRCQLVSVPGQSKLLHRRRYLLETADAVVFVADSRPPAIAESAPSYATTVRIAERVAKAVPLGIIVQANKQDLDGALRPEEVLRALGAHEAIPVIGSVASTAEGVMQTFILAVRLATDRVRTLLLGETLAELPMSDETPESLHAAMLAEEPAAIEPEPMPEAVPEPVPSSAPLEVALALDTIELPSPDLPDLALPHDAAEVVVVEFELEQPSVAASEPEPEPEPEPEREPEPVPVPTGRANRLASLAEITLPVAHEFGAGHVWPPPRGRAAFAAATSGAFTVPALVQPWAPDDALELVTDGGWLLHSTERWLFDGESEAKLALLSIVRRVAPTADQLPDTRALAIARDGARWRLWMLTPRLPTVADRLRERGLLDRAPPGVDSVAIQDGRLVRLRLDERADGAGPDEVPVAQVSELLANLEGRAA